MTIETAPSRWRKAKTALAIILAIICAPIVVIALLASVSDGRR